VVQNKFGRVQNKTRRGLMEKAESQKDIGHRAEKAGGGAQSIGFGNSVYFIMCTAFRMHYSVPLQ
jgi:hypothetical protein